MVFNELREAIVTRLKEAMPKEVDVAGHPGVIDTAELGRLCMAAPALRVSVLKVLGVDRARGNDAAELQIGVYIVAGAGKGGVGADEVALSILTRVLAVVNGENWNLQCVENRPENISADNLFDGSLPGLSGGRLVSLWGVAWRQRVIMPPLIDFTAPDRYPTDPDAGKVPAPWNDPLAEFLRLGLRLKTVPDETGAPHIYSDDIIAVRGENHE